MYLAPCEISQLTRKGKATRKRALALAVDAVEKPHACMQNPDAANHRKGNGRQVSFVLSALFFAELVMSYTCSV